MSITAWGQHHGGQVVYSYEVKNLGTKPIKRFLIGHSQVAPAGAELSVAPVTMGSTSWVAPEASTSPAGWGVATVYPSESARFSLEWVEASYFRKLWPASQSEYAPTPVAVDRGIPPGSEWKGFVVKLPAIDSAYVSGHATVDLGDELLPVQVLKGDRLPPQLNFGVTRVNQNQTRGEWAIFKVEASATDNHDPEPLVIFEPVTANEALPGADLQVDSASRRAWNVKLRNVPGRTYVLRASAVDASGNKNSRVYEYSVPR